MMDPKELKPYIAARVAKELKDGDVVNLGIGLPTLVPSFLLPDVQVILQSENGIVGAGTAPRGDESDPAHITDAAGQPSSVVPGGAFIDSSVSFGLIRGGHVDCTILGALEVDSEGSLSNWIIPGKKLPGMGGAMDLVVGAKKVIVAMEHTAKGKPKILTKCRLPFTAVNCVDMIVTEMGVFEVTGDGLLLTEYNPEYTVDDIRAATEADFELAGRLKPILI
ncbi:MAG: 3-oxoacid CoA-transferase subunit B [Clostridiales Family XIII bacterium]|jgi:acetate CoA/acetoacetate CoA-transferase beta subunit|nr:3-oxoacid CoA-transferase subunit B [Clostridiales Family XIII bacterium]